MLEAAGAQSGAKGLRDVALLRLLHDLGLRRSEGSVRARANQYRLSWDEANPGSCGLQDGQHGHAPPEELESAAIGGNMLMVAGARAEEVAQFIVCATEPSG